MKNNNKQNKLYSLSIFFSNSTTVIQTLINLQKTIKNNTKVTYNSFFNLHKKTNYYSALHTKKRSKLYGFVVFTKSVSFWIYTMSLYNVFAHFSRWFSFIYEYIFNSFWLSNSHKYSFYFNCLNFLFLISKTPALTNTHLFLFKKQSGGEKSFFFKFYNESSESLEVLTMPTNTVIKDLGMHNEFTLLGIDNQISTFTNKYKYVLSYWLFLTNIINAKSLKTSKINIKVNSKTTIFLFKNLKVVGLFYAIKKKNLALKKQFFLENKSYTTNYFDFWIESALRKGLHIRRRLEKNLVKTSFDALFKKINFLQGLAGFKNVTTNLSLFVNDAFMFNYFNWFTNDLIYSTNGLVYFKGYFPKFLNEKLIVKNVEKSEVTHIIENLKTIKKYKFNSKHLKIVDSIISKQTSIHTDKNLTSVFKELVASFSVKYLVLLILLSSYSNNPRFSYILKNLSHKNLYLNNAFLSNYLNFYKYWSNTTPFFYLNREVINSVVKIQTKEEVGDLAVYIKQYVGGFVEDLVGRKVFIKIRTKISVSMVIKRLLLDIYRINWMWQKAIGAGFFFFDMLSVLWYSFFNKDLSFLMTWFSRTMSKLTINKHKRFIRLFKTLSQKYSDVFLYANNVVGFKFDIRGKVGVAGNSKKRHLAFNVGKTSFSRKNLRVEYQQGLVYTDTGVLGVTMILSF